MFDMIDLNRNKNLELKENVLRLYCAIMMGDDNHGLFLIQLPLANPLTLLIMHVAN
jgi:hypothetical protein